MSRNTWNRHWICWRLIAAFLLGLFFLFPVFLQQTKAAAVENDCTRISSARPGKQSTLLVLLDRSGSLTASDGFATDPNRYSTSITRALADLWPGTMIVIPFGEPRNAASLPVLRANLSDQTQLNRLKAQIEQYPIEGGTPLAPAMKKALDPGAVPELQQPASGSRAIIITDGSPTVTKDFPQSEDQQIQEITAQSGLSTQFHNRCLAISPFGLKTEAKADNLLSKVAQTTGGVYTHVQSPEELAQKVIQLYRDWQGLNLSEATQNPDNSYSVFINRFANRARIVAFHAVNAPDIALASNNGKTPVTGVQPVSVDPHYTMYSLDMQAYPSGTYKVQVGQDSNAQVYALADHDRFHVQAVGIPPTSITIGQPFTTQAALFDGQKRYVPTDAVEVSMNTTYYEGNNGRGQTVTQTLNQPQQGVFPFTSDSYSHPGKVTVQFQARYQGIQESSPVYTTSVLYQCNKGLWACTWERHGTLISFLTPLLLLLLAGLLYYIWWRRQPEPAGILRSAVMSGKRFDLSTLPAFPQKLIHKSRVTSDEIFSADPLAFPDFGVSKFLLKFKNNATWLCTEKNNTVPVSIVRPSKPGSGPPAKTPSRAATTINKQAIDVPNGEEAELPPGSMILIRGKQQASFH